MATFYFHAVPLALVLLLGTMVLVECGSKEGLDIEELVKQEKYFSAHGNLLREMFQNARKKRHVMVPSEQLSETRVKRDNHGTLVEADLLNEHSHSNTKSNSKSKSKALDVLSNHNKGSAILVKLANNQKQAKVKGVQHDESLLGISALEKSPQNNAELAQINLLDVLDN